MAMRAFFHFLRSKLVGSTSNDKNTIRPRLQAELMPGVIYAIGDVHGCLDELRQLEQKIVDDAEGIDGEKWIIMLGDYVDRGDQSASVLDHLLAKAPRDFKRVCLAGNHEEMMLRAMSQHHARQQWLKSGGRETLQSYGISMGLGTSPRPASSQFDAILQSRIPDEHIEFLRNLPASLKVDDYFFAHAGIRPDVSLDQQSEQDLLWIRDDFLSVELNHKPVIIHGHTPAPDPQIAPGRIGVDTGCYATGRLTAVKIQKNKEAEFLFSQSTL